MVYRGSHVIVFKVSCVASKCIKCFIKETSMLRILSLQSPSKIAQEHEIIAQLPPRPLSDPELLASMLESLLESHYCQNCIEAFAQKLVFFAAAALDATSENATSENLSWTVSMSLSLRRGAGVVCFIRLGVLLNFMAKQSDGDCE